MLCEWRIRKKGSKADPYVDYGVFPAVFCLKINHGGAFTHPTKIRYKGGKPSFDYYYKEPKTDLDNRLKKLSSDQDETLNLDESLLVNELDNDLFIGNEMLRDNDEDVINDVSEDEWLQKSLRLVGIKKKHTVENDNSNAFDRDDGSNIDDGSNRDDGSASDDDSDSQDSDFLVDPDNIIDDVEFEEEKVNLDELDSGSDSEYEGERKKALEMYHKINKANASNAESSGKVPQFSCENENDDSGSKGVVLGGSKGKGIKDKGESCPAHDAPVEKVVKKRKRSEVKVNNCILGVRAPKATNVRLGVTSHKAPDV
nr:transposase, MuDR [Tanacetum cinerariifolium]